MLYFIHSTSVLPFYIDVVLTLSIVIWSIFVPGIYDGHHSQRWIIVFYLHIKLYMCDTPRSLYETESVFTFLKCTNYISCRFFNFTNYISCRPGRQRYKDVLLAKEEYYMRMLATLYPYGLNDNINSLNINLRSYDFTKFNSLDTPYFSYPQTRQRRSHGHRKCNSQTTLDFNDFTSKIEDLFLAREHRALYAFLRSVSHQYLKNTLCYFASEGKSIRLEVYHILHAFYSQYCKPNRVNPKHIVYFTLPFIHKLQEKVNLSRILNNSAVKSNIPIAAKKFKIYVSYKYGPTIGQSLFSYNKVLSTITKYHDGLPVCDCTDNFPNVVYKPHGHVHTGNLNVIDNTQLRSLMKKEAKFRETPSCSKYKLDHLYQDAIDKLTTKLARHSKSNSGIFYHLKNIILQDIKLILKQLPSKFLHHRY